MSVSDHSVGHHIHGFSQSLGHRSPLVGSGLGRQNPAPSPVSTIADSTPGEPTAPFNAGYGNPSPTTFSAGDGGVSL